MAIWQMAYGRCLGSQEREQKSEIRGRRSSRILKFAIRKLSNPQSAILFAHIRSSLSVLDLPQHRLLEALAEKVGGDFAADPFDKLGAPRFRERV